MYVHIQLQQLFNLAIILLLGKYAAHLYLPWLNIVAIILFALIIEHLFIYIKNKQISYFSYSSLSTSMGVMLMMATPQLWIYMLIIGLGLFQKHFLTVDEAHSKKHFFNPSNFALLLGLFLFYDDAHIVLGQLGDALWLNIAIGVLALFMLIRVDRWIIPLVFSMTYLLFEYLLVVQYDPIMLMEEIYYRFFSVSFMLFILFMLTDPKTTPDKPLHQVVFASLIAFGAALFDALYGFRVQHLFLVLSLLSLWIPLLMLWKKDKSQIRLILITVMILLLVISVIISIEIKPPYYFTMDE